MSTARARPSGVERFFGEDEIIVTKTDLKGRLTYANPLFLSLAGLSEAEALGQPHNIIRHPEMPRCIFKLLWDTIAAGNELFAYVCNMAVNGDHYWVLAHVTPTFDGNGGIVGYHSNRRKPRREAVERATALYRELLAEERRQGDGSAGLRASYALLERKLAATGQQYDEFVFSL